MKQRLKWRLGEKIHLCCNQNAHFSPLACLCSLKFSLKFPHKILPSSRSLLLLTSPAVSWINISQWLWGSPVCQIFSKNPRKKGARQKTRENSLWPLKTRGLSCSTNHFQAIWDGVRKIYLKAKRTSEKGTSKQCKGVKLCHRETNPTGVL